MVGITRSKVIFFLARHPVIWIVNLFGFPPKFPRDQPNAELWFRVLKTSWEFLHLAASAWLFQVQWDTAVCCNNPQWTAHLQGLAMPMRDEMQLRGKKLSAAIIGIHESCGLKGVSCRFFELFWLWPRQFLDLKYLFWMMHNWPGMVNPT